VRESAVLQRIDRRRAGPNAIKVECDGERLIGQRRGNLHRHLAQQIASAHVIQKRGARGGRVADGPLDGDEDVALAPVPVEVAGERMERVIRRPLGRIAVVGPGLHADVKGDAPPRARRKAGGRQRHAILRGIQQRHRFRRAMPRAVGGLHAQAADEVLQPRHRDRLPLANHRRMQRERRAGEAVLHGDSRHRPRRAGTNRREQGEGAESDAGTSVYH